MKKLLPLVLFVSLIGSLDSCKLALVDRYDPIIDNAVTGVQQKITRFFVKAETDIGTPAFNYENYKSFYEDLKVDMGTLRIRSAAVNEGGIADKEIILLDENIQNLEKLHKLGIHAYDEVALLKDAFDRQFTAIIKLQMGLKSRNSKNN